MTIWKDTSVLYRAKETHVKKYGGRLRLAFGLFLGDLPVVNFNETTQKFEPVVNLRGRAYAARKRACYRSNRRKEVRFRSLEMNG